MPWKERNVVDLRKEFVMQAMEPNCNFSELCREHGISRQKGYKRLKRFKHSGVEGLRDRSRAPKKQALSTDAELVLQILELKAAKPRWGAPKIHDKLVALHGGDVPSMRTVGRILDRAGMVKKRRKRPKLVGRPKDAPVTDAKDPNDLWTVDFKGWWTTGDQKRCEPLTIRDQATRFVFVVQILPSTKGQYVKEVFTELFRSYGLPKAILSDNGSPFACTSALGGFSHLSVWWVSLGIEVRRSRPGCPQDNGGHERMHADIRFDLEDEPADTLQAQQVACDAWRHEFNHVRPHAALAGRTPSKMYEKSPRRFRTQLVVSSHRRILRKVASNGRFRFQGVKVIVGRSFAGYDVGIEHVDEGTVYHVWFFDKRLGFFDINERCPRVEPLPESDETALDDTEPGTVELNPEPKDKEAA
jgi:transposase InsO family protein